MAPTSRAHQDGLENHPQKIAGKASGTLILSCHKALVAICTITRYVDGRYERAKGREQRK
jgi:hypothetical protein